MANKFTDAVFVAKLLLRDKAVLWALAHRTDNVKGTCWPSYSTIARDAGCSRSTAEKAIASLTEMGVISVVAKQPTAPGKWNNVYRLDLAAIQALAHTGGRYRTESNAISEGGTVAEGGSETVPEDEVHSTVTRSHNSSLNSPDRTRQRNNNHAVKQSETERIKATNLNAEELASVLRESLQLSGSVSELKALPDLPTLYLSDAAEWAANHNYWSKLRGKTFKDFVRACLKENALLDQFEEARAAGWKRPDASSCSIPTDDDALSVFEIVED